MKDRNISGKRLFLLAFFFVSVFAVLCVRLFFLQLGEHSSLAVMASAQHMTELAEAEERAGIYDRNGDEITGGKTYLYYYIDGQKLKEKGKKVLQRYDCEEIRTTQEGYHIWKGKDESRQRAAITAEYGCTAVTCRKRYGDRQEAVHLLGYTGLSEEGEEEGLCGLEKKFDERLKKGSVRKYLYRDAAGRYLGGGVVSDREIREKFCTTIDLGLQREAEKILEETDNPGGIIVSTVDTGEILAYASYPVYSPDDIADFLESEGGELTDRLSGASYPPGSVFKLVVAAAAIEAGTAEGDTVFECRGSVKIGDTTVRCSTGGENGHGKITLREAIADSCNCALIELGMKTGGEKILEKAAEMGFGCDVCPQITELTGNLPEDTEECGIANLSIGQGSLLVTPLQVTAMMRSIACGGVFSRLHILTEETESDLEKYDLMPADIRSETPEEKRRIMSKSTAASLLSMMCDVTDSGTASRISEYTDAQAGGKTGSAQSSMSGRSVVHGWFSGFYPQEDPQYVITVFMEDGGGSGACIPAAGKMIDCLCRREI